ncbi:P-loop containing nucleoside triphosphate hydrolase protein [Martensiomyces pterosporus]|nr:P-loop containing nucleoside triphosphate hydrolase protein [Martensiomyces pterosporus]
MRARQSAMQAQLAKGAAESASSQRTLTTDSQQSTAASADPKDDSIEYSVLFTTQKTKKVKAWTEGTLTFYPGNHRVVLKDEDGATMTSSLFPKSKAIEAGGEVDHGQYLIQIESIRGQESTASASSAPVGLELQGSLKRRHNALERAPTRRAAGSGLAKNGLQRVRLHKRQSSDEVAEAPSAAGPHSTAASSTAAQRPPKLARGSSLQSSRTANLPLATSTLTRVPFTPPASQTPKYLHFPRRSELLQHVGVSKGYNFGPSRQLTASITYQRWDDYQRQFSALLQENLMAELSSLAIRYFFMAREKYDSNAQRAQASAQGGSSGGRRGRMLAGRTASIAQVCKSVGVLFFNECTIRQPFMEGMAFRAQLSKGSVQFSKGDSVVLELSRRESYAGYAKDDTWAVSTSEDFPTESTFLARSVFFGPSKSNTLELMLVGEEDAKAAARIFNGSSEEHGKTRRGAQQTRSTPTVVAVRCLDSASDWTMMDTVEEHLRPDTLPCLPHLLGIADEPIPQVAPEVDVQATVAKIEQILGDKRRELSLNSDQFEILRQVVMSAVSIYLPVEGSSPITIVHGPFGTGKSFLVSAIVICLDQIAYEFPEIFGGTGDGGSSLSASSLSGDWLGDGPADVLHTDNAEAASAEVRQPRLRALVSSMTNFAVDNMLRALLKQGYDQFLRIGNLKRISKEILPYVCRSSSSATEDIKELEAMLAETMDEKEQEAIEVAMQRLRQQRIKDAIDAAFVVGATCLSSATAALRSTRFPVVILDEACQIVEPMALIALASAGCRRLVLVGDPLQLPPTLTTRAAKAAEGKGLDRALFDRLVQMGHKPRFLSTQYRCHPRIGSLCNQLFYQGRLQHGIAPEDRLPLFPDVPPLAFLDTAGQEKQSGKSQSFFNKGEMDMAVQLVRRMLMGGIDAESIGVIALYKTQADMLREQLASVLGQRNSVQQLPAAFCH